MLTGHHDRGDKLWTWCFRAKDFAVFKIDASRGSQVLLEMLGADYAGTLVCDFFSPYRKFKELTRCLIQFCLAHLIRDVRFLETLPHKPGVRFANKLLKLLQKLFPFWRPSMNIQTSPRIQRLVEQMDIYDVVAVSYEHLSPTDYDGEEADRADCVIDGVNIGLKLYSLWLGRPLGFKIYQAYKSRPELGDFDTGDVIFFVGDIKMITSKLKTRKGKA